MTEYFGGLKTIPLGEAFGKRAGVAKSATPNPFSRDTDGSRNMTKISEMIRDDKPNAIRLCREAGDDPRSWMPDNPR